MVTSNVVPGVEFKHLWPLKSFVGFTYLLVYTPGKMFNSDVFPHMVSKAILPSAAKFSCLLWEKAVFICSSTYKE